MQCIYIMHFSHIKQLLKKRLFEIIKNIWSEHWPSYFTQIIVCFNHWQAQVHFGTPQTDKSNINLKENLLMLKKQTLMPCPGLSYLLRINALRAWWIEIVMNSWFWLDICCIRKHIQHWSTKLSDLIITRLNVNEKCSTSDVEKINLESAKFSYAH